MLLKMAIYQRLKGQHSPATWFKEAKLNEAMQWLGRGYLPSRRAWYDFRDRVGDAVEQLHHVELLAPVQANALTAKKKQAKGETPIPHQEFSWNAAERT